MNFSNLVRQHWAALRALLVFTVIVGIAYPLFIWLIAQRPGLQNKANGSIIEVGGKPVGSSLIGQSFTDTDGNPLPRYFQSRPSAAGDGTNDAPALAQADVGVAMNTGTSAAKEAGNMVDLDSDPTKLIEIVEIGKQLLITRGALTTFSIANDIAKYFAIIPAMFVAMFPGLDVLNVMRLHSPQSAILSAVIFNALVIIALIPLSLRGVRYTPSSASKLLSRNLYVYGLGGIIAPFIGIKLIDLVIQLFPGM